MSGARRSIAILALALAAPARAEVEAGGYLKSFLMSVRPEGGQPSVALLNRGRLRLSGGLGGETRWEAAYDLAPILETSPAGGARIFGGALGSELPYRLADLGREIGATDLGSSRLSVRQNLDRLMLSLPLAGADVTLGRQPVAFGSARAVSPTDVILPFDFATLDQEDRVGVDALRARVPLGELSEADAGAVAGHGGDVNRSAFFARAKTNVAKTDLAAIVMRFQGNTLAGIDVQGAIGGAGLWLEAARAWADSGTYDRASLGADYRLSGDLYGFAEYHYSGAASGSVPEAFTEGGVYLSGRHYLIPGLSYAFTPLLSGTLTAYWNATDGSVLWAPSVEYNLTENSYWNAGAIAGTGASGPTEFGRAPAFFFTSIRYYF